MTSVREGDTVCIDADDFASGRSLDEARDDVRGALATGAPRLVVMNALLREEEPEWFTTVEPWCQALGKLGSPSLRAFVVDTYYQPLTRQASVRCGELGAVLERCPALELLYVAGSCTFDRVRHERLESLSVIGDPTLPRTLDAILRGHLPRLSRLALGFSYEREEAPGATEAFLDALDHAMFPALRELHIGESSNPLRVFDAVMRSKLAKQLSGFSLGSRAFFDEEDEGLDLIRTHREVLATIERVWLPTEEVMSMTDDDLAKLVPGLRGLDDEGGNAFGPEVYRDRQ